MIISLLPQHFLHVVDLRTNVTRVEEGPQNFLKQTHENIVCGPLPCISVPPGHYCIIKDPIKLYEHGLRVELSYGLCAVKVHQDPFALYPGESVEGCADFGKNGDYKSALLKIPVILSNHALKVRARYDFVDEGGIQRCADDVWHIEGPCTYTPVPQVVMLNMVQPVIIREHEALRIRAQRDFLDKQGRSRVTGEEYLVRCVGAYLPGVFEQVVSVEVERLVTDNCAVHVRALRTIEDFLGKSRHAGEEWLITVDDCERFIPDVGMEEVSLIHKTVLRVNEYCVILNPVNNHGVNVLGTRKLCRGPCSFFLMPGEVLENGIESAFVMGSDEAVVIQANQTYEDVSLGEPVSRKPGDRWMITGPCSFIPDIQITVINKRKSISLKDNEGIYVRDTETGKVCVEMGPQAYMLQVNEVLWEKTLDTVLEQILQNGGGISKDGSDDIRKMAYFDQARDGSSSSKRDNSRVVTYRCPHNTAVQVYDFLNKRARVVYGPKLVILGPHENFTILSLSAGKPKKADALLTICLMFGPDYITDIFEVETSDHARLRIKAAFNNHFEINPGVAEADERLFSVPDFIGFACRRVGGAIRSAVASVSFDEFHRHSSAIIKEAVFGRDSHGQICSQMKFDVNGLIISSVDVQSVEPVDSHMRDSLVKSVQMAIEISTKSIENAAKHEANRLEQEARGLLERQKVFTESDSERLRTQLYELRAVAAAVQSTGQAKAEAKACAERALIEAHADITSTKLAQEAANIAHVIKLECDDAIRKAELDCQRQLTELELNKAEALSNVEVLRLTGIINCLGRDTLKAIATAEPQMKLRLLESLGLKATFITDGKNPINLFNTANGLIDVGCKN